MIQVSTEEILLTPPKALNNASSRHAPRVDWSRIVLNVLLPLAGVVVALVVGGVILVILKANPLAAYAALVKGVVGSQFGLTQTLVKATPLLLVGLGICIAFRANVINIGGEGQIIAGALMATWWPLTFAAWPVEYRGGRRRPSSPRACHAPCGRGRGPG